MTRQMTIKKARKIDSFPCDEIRCYCETIHCEHLLAKSFIWGYESRQAEIDELKKEIKELLRICGGKK